jgi:hypothetical protein
MGTMTFLELRDEVQYGLHNRGTAAGGPTAVQLGRYVNWAYNHVSRPNIYRHRELQATQNVTLATDDRDYTLATVPHAIYSVYNSTDGYKLNPRDIRRIDDMPIVSGRPSWYAVWGNELIVSPQPTSSENGDTVVVRYWQAPTVLSGDGDVTVLRYEWDEIIIAGAEWRAWARLKQREHALESRDEFGTLVNEVQDILKIEGEDTGWQIEPELYVYQRGEG